MHTKVIYELGTKNIFIDKNKKILSTKSQINDGIIYGEMNLTLKEFGYTLNFDNMSGKIEINK